MPSKTYVRTLVSLVTTSCLAMTGLAANASTTSAVPEVRLVVGARAVTDHTGLRWSPDTAYARGGRLWKTSHVIARTADQRLFQTERYGVRGYRIPLRTPGVYTVTLGEAEAYWSRVGQRQFSVTAEGHTVASRVDILKRVHRFTADQLVFTVRVTDGALDLGFTNIRDLAKLTNLRVRLQSRIVPAPAAPAQARPSAPAVAGAKSPVAAVPVLPATRPPVTPEQFGARGDGVSDDTAALQRAFDSAPPGTSVLLGRTYAHHDVLHLRTSGLHVTGQGRLLATDESRSSVWLEADGVLMDGHLTIETGRTTRRWSAWEQMGIRVRGHQGITLRGVTVIGAAAAGIYVGNQASHFVLDHVTVQGSRADGIHMTGGSHDGQVLFPTTIQTGDDGVAVVSYGADGAPCHDITVTSPRVLGTTWGRGLSVVGGTHVVETNIHVEHSNAAAVYIAAEGNPWNTAAPQDVLIDGGSILGANMNSSVDHGAVLVLSGERGTVPINVTVRGLSISDTRASASRDVGVITYGDAPRGIEFDNLTITGGPRSAYQGNTPGGSFRTRNWLQNGVRLADKG